MTNFDISAFATDTSFMNGRATVSEDTGSPENKRDIPCDGCPNAAKCEAGFLECAAFRNWASRGDFADRDVARLIRGAK